MRLKISHRTEYTYDSPVSYALQRLRVRPQNGNLQTVLSWDLKIEGAKEEVRFVDQFENDATLLSIDAGSNTMTVEARGEIETIDKAGVFGEHRGFAPLWLFQHQTPLTAAGETIEDLATSIGPGSDLSKLHELMTTVSTRVAYTQGSTTSTTTAEEALKLGAGVCQDHTHVFVSAARLLGMPARYVSGYLMMDETIEQAASHAWAEAHVPMLGWVAFDPSNCISPDDRYVRLASGRDYRDAMPISGIRLGWAEERLAVSITVEQ